MEDQPASGGGPRTGLPPAIEALPRVLLLYLLTTRLSLYKQAWFELPFLPFVAWFDAVPKWLFCPPVLLVLYSAPVAIVIGYRLRTASLLYGLALLVIILSSRPLYSTSGLLLASLFLLCGLYRGSDRIFRVQLATVYGGAALNKFLQPDWWNGNYLHNFARVFDGPLTAPLHYIGQSASLSQALGITAILTEAALAILLLHRRTVLWGVALGVVFHGGMLLLTAGVLSRVYFYLACAAYTVLLPLPGTIGGSPPVGRLSVTYPLYAYFILLLLLYRADRIWERLAPLF